MAKKIVAQIKLQVKAGQANPSPPIGPALGQKGLNIMSFCKEFNARTANMEPGTPTPVIITAYEDKSFTFITKKPPVSYYLIKHAKIPKGSQTPGRASAGKISMADIRKIAEEKLVDMTSASIEAAMSEIKGSARAMGLQVVE